jgi:hypothetical protein
LVRAWSAAGPRRSFLRGSWRTYNGIEDLIDWSGLALTRAGSECEDCRSARSKIPAEHFFPTMHSEERAPELESATPHDSEQLLEILYQELRRLAHQRLSPGGGVSFVSTELVHEVYLRIVGGGDLCWVNRGHFLASSATAMRRILKLPRRLLTPTDGGYRP